jgi:hypothetical protein
VTEHAHVFDPVSGYCIRGCAGYREDGRVVHQSGSVFRPGQQQQDPEKAGARHGA